jgi:hypothetical protein
MVNIKVPLNPVQKRGLWPPKGGREYTVLDTDDWWKIAAREHIDAWALIEFNFQTHVPEEVNWYLQELVGCRHSKDRGRNYAFLGADPKRGKIYLPPVPPPPRPTPIPWPDQLKKLQYEVEHSNDPQKDRFLCMLKAMENRHDDRVIFWSDIAPGDEWVAPLGVEGRGIGKGLIDAATFGEFLGSSRPRAPTASAVAEIKLGKNPSQKQPRAWKPDTGPDPTENLLVIPTNMMSGSQSCGRLRTSFPVAKTPLAAPMSSRRKTLLSHRCRSPRF